MRARILHIIQRTSYDGASILPQRLIEALPDYNHFLLSCYKGSAHEEFIVSGVKVSYLSNQENIKKYSLIKLLRFYLFLSKNEFDLIHYHHGGILLLLIALMVKRENVIHHIHTRTITGKSSTSSVPFLQKFVLKYIDKKITTVSCADHVLDYYKKNISHTDRIEVIPNFCPYPFIEKKVLKKKIGYLGRLTFEKGFTLFNEIANKILEKNRDITFWVKGDYNENFGFKLTEKINFIDPSFSVKEFLEEMDLIIFLSSAPEAMPLVILESINCDVGVICSESEYSMEIFGQGYPLFVKSAETTEAIKKINLFYSQEFNNRNLTAIHNKIYLKYRMESILPRYNELYRRLLLKSNNL